MQETTRRQYPRLVPRETIQVYRSNQLIGAVVNLSQEGMMLMTSERLADDAIHSLVLRTQLPTEDVSLVLHCGVDCLWSTDSREGAEQQDAFWAGCHIIDISDSDLLKLQKILQRAADHH